MKKVVYKILVLIALGVIFAGCSTRSLKVQESFTDLVSDKNQAYVVFARPYSFMGGAHNIDIMEFDESTFSPKAVIHLANDERTVYPVKPGKSYFFTNVGANENITMVDLKPGEIQYINMGVSSNSVFFPIHIADSRLSLKEKLLNQQCNDMVLRRYLFKPVDSDSELGTQSKDTKLSSPMQLTLSCENGKVANVKDEFHGTSMQEIDSLQLVKVDEKYKQEIKKRSTEFSDDIKTLYPVWDLKMKNIPLSEKPVVFVLKEASKENYNQFTNVSTKVKKVNDKISNESYEEFIQKSSQLFNEYKNDKHTLKLVYELHNFDDGSMAGRYFTSGFSAAGAYKDIGVLDVTVSIVDANENTIGKVRLTTIEAFGLLGGVNTMVSDILDIVQEYVVNNYMKPQS